MAKSVIQIHTVDVRSVSSMPGNDFVLFSEPYNIKKKIPCTVSMKSLDNKLPPEAILERGSDAIRTYWNSKNKRRRVKND